MSWENSHSEQQFSEDSILCVVKSESVNLLVFARREEFLRKTFPFKCFSKTVKLESKFAEKLPYVEDRRCITVRQHIPSLQRWRIYSPSCWIRYWRNMQQGLFVEPSGKKFTMVQSRAEKPN